METVSFRNGSTATPNRGQSATYTLSMTREQAREHDYALAYNAGRDLSRPQVERDEAYQSWFRNGSRHDWTGAMTASEMRYTFYRGWEAGRQ